jgi:MFS transporter, FSR family, fosmidomycin resistance protein
MKLFQHTFKVSTISFAHLIHDLYTSFLFPLLPLLMEKLQFSNSLAGVATFFMRVPALFNPAIGIVADQINQKYMVILSPAVTSICMSMIGLAPNYAILLMFLFTAGISSSVFHVPAPVLIRHFARERTGLGMSFFMIGGEGARTLGPLLIMAVVTNWSLEFTYSVLPIGLLTSLFLFITLRDIPNISQKPQNKVSIIAALSAAKQMKGLFYIVLGNLLSKSFTASVIITYISVYLTEQGLSPFLAGSSLSIVAFASVLGVMLAGPVSDMVGRNKVLLLVGLVAPVVMILFLQFTGWIAIVLLFLVSFIAFSTSPVMMALVQEEGAATPALANGIYMALNFFMSSMITLFAGVIADWIGLKSTFLLCALLSLIGVPFMLIGIRLGAKKIKLP